MLRITLSISFFVEREFNNKSIFQTNNAKRSLNPPVRNNMLKKRLAGSKFRVHFHFKAILQSRTNNHSSGYNHVVHFPLCVHPIHLRPNIRNHTNPNNVHQTVHLILPLQQAFLHSKRQKIVFFHLHYALLSFAASTLIVRLALHHADLFIHEIGVLLRVLRWNQRELNKQHN